MIALRRCALRRSPILNMIRMINKSRARPILIPTMVMTIPMAMKIGRIDLEEAQRRRDAAYAAQYGRQRWRDLRNPTGALDPSPASAIEKQAETWRHGK